MSGEGGMRKEAFGKQTIDRSSAAPGEKPASGNLRSRLFLIAVRVREGSGYLTGKTVRTIRLGWVPGFTRRTRIVAISFLHPGRFYIVVRFLRLICMIFRIELAKITVNDKFNSIIHSDSAIVPFVGKFYMNNHIQSFYRNFALTPFSLSPPGPSSGKL